MFYGLKNAIPRPLKRATRRFLENVRDSLRYRLSRQRPDLNGIARIVFVCKGNICRSAFAEKYFDGKHDADGIGVISCGLDVDQGGYSPPDAVRVANELGVDLASHQAQALSACKPDRTDLIIAMEYGQYKRLRGAFPAEDFRVCLLREFAPLPDRIFCNIFDPFGLGEEEFRKCFRLMATALDALRAILLERTT